ncbi:MAG: uroporphyrinogen decarboxylase family protein [Elusimicrobiota bacterium]
MDNTKRFQNTMAFKPVDRLPVIEWASWWTKTVNRWYTEGLPVELKDVFDIREYFGLDPYRQHVFPGMRPSYKKELLPEHQAVTDMQSYLRVKPYLYSDKPFNPEVLQQHDELQRQGKLVIWLSFEGFFWFPRKLFGIEQHLYAFYDYPDVMHAINNDLVEYNFRVLDSICKVCKPDFMTFMEDLSYNHGPMLSHGLFKEFLVPYYKRIVPRLKDYGIVPVIDSDGDITQLIPWYEEVGIDAFLPLERQAGVDLAALRVKHPRVRFIGGYDKMVMKHGEAAMRTEFERLLPVMKQGGYIPSVDHQTPPEVSIENYKIYVRLLREYCVKAAE